MPKSAATRIEEHRTRKYTEAVTSLFGAVGNADRDAYDAAKTNQERKNLITEKLGSVTDKKKIGQGKDALDYLDRAIERTAKATGDVDSIPASGEKGHKRAKAKNFFSGASDAAKGALDGVFSKSGGILALFTLICAFAFPPLAILGGVLLAGNMVRKSISEVRDNSEARDASYDRTIEKHNPKKEKEPERDEVADLKRKVEVAKLEKELEGLGGNGKKDNQKRVDGFLAKTIEDAYKSINVELGNDKNHSGMKYATDDDKKAIGEAIKKAVKGKYIDISSKEGRAKLQKIVVKAVNDVGVRHADASGNVVAGPVQQLGSGGLVNVEKELEKNYKKSTQQTKDGPSKEATSLKATVSTSGKAATAVAEDVLGSTRSGGIMANKSNSR